MSKFDVALTEARTPSMSTERFKKSALLSFRDFRATFEKEPNSSCTKSIEDRFCVPDEFRSLNLNWWHAANCGFYESSWKSARVIDLGIDDHFVGWETSTADGGPLFAERLSKQDIAMNCMKIELTGRAIGDDGLAVISRKLRRNGFHAIGLAFNRLTSASLETIARIFGSGTECSIDLRGNDLDYSETCKFLNTLASSSLVGIGIGGSRYASGLDQFAAILEWPQHDQLKSLKISWPNSVNANSQMKLFFESIKSKQLRELSIYVAPECETNDIFEIVLAISKNQDLANLEALSIVGIGIDDRAIAVLASAPFKLKKFDFWGNNTGPTAAEALTVGHTFHSLRCLTIGGDIKSSFFSTFLSTRAVMQLETIAFSSTIYDQDDIIGLTPVIKLPRLRDISVRIPTIAGIIAYCLAKAAEMATLRSLECTCLTYKEAKLLTNCATLREIQEITLVHSDIGVLLMLLSLAGGNRLLALRFSGDGCSSDEAARLISSRSELSRLVELNLTPHFPMPECQITPAGSKHLAVAPFWGRLDDIVIYPDEDAELYLLTKCELRPEARVCLPHYRH